MEIDTFVVMYDFGNWSQSCCDNLNGPVPDPKKKVYKQDRSGKLGTFDAATVEIALQIACN